MTNNIYKVLRGDEWQEASQTGQIITDLDRGDGFIHLSTASQLALTLFSFFQNLDSVMLLQLDLEKIDTSKLHFEEPYPNKGERKRSFPHLYSQLNTDQISNIWVLERTAFNLPEEVLFQSENFPIN